MSHDALYLHKNKVLMVTDLSAFLNLCLHPVFLILVCYLPFLIPFLLLFILIPVHESWSDQTKAPNEGIEIVLSFVSVRGDEILVWHSLPSSFECVCVYCMIQVLVVSSLTLIFIPLSCSCSRRRITRRGEGRPTPFGWWCMCQRMKVLSEIQLQQKHQSREKRNGTESCLTNYSTECHLLYGWRLCVSLCHVFVIVCTSWMRV